MASEVVSIDGSVLEGGGQILRMATSLSILMGKPIRLYNIRAGRSSPGIKPQHKMGLELGRDISNGKMWGVAIGSDEIKFHPGKLTGGIYSADTLTAGSVALLIQVALPCALFCPTPVELKLRGGTNADMAPQIDYVETVLKKLLEKFGATFDCHIKKRGYFPRGGGEVIIKINPVNKLKAVNLMRRGELTSIWGQAFVAGSLQIHDAVEMGSTAADLIRKKISSHNIVMTNYKEKPGDAVGDGFGINIFAETSRGCIFGASAIGKRNILPKQLAPEAVKDLFTSLDHDICVDAHAQDQIIIFMALADGRSCVRCGPVTLHTKTAIHIAEKLTKAKFRIEEYPDDTNVIHCDGIGYQRDVTSPMDV